MWARWVVFASIVCSCGHGSNQGPEVDAGLIREGPVDVRTTTDPSTGDVTVDVLEPGSGASLVSVRFERATRLLHWSTADSPTIQTGPLDPAVEDPELEQMLADTAVLGWGWSLSTEFFDHAPRNCPEFPFRGDHECTVPSLFRGVFDRVCGSRCDTLTQCERHDDCYYGMPVEVCATSTTIYTPAKRTCDAIFGDLTCDEGGLRQVVCRAVLTHATGWGGGRGFQPGDPCENENYCGRYSEKECCADRITGGICSSSIPECYCNLCKAIIGPAAVYDVSFPEGPGIDISACGASSSTFNSQTLSVDDMGVFDELWPPPTMDVLRISGTMVHEVQVDGVLDCLAGPASNGSFTATWVPLLTRYDGTYDFDGQVGPITLVRRPAMP